MSESLVDARALAAFLSVSLPSIRKFTRLTDIPRVHIGAAVRFDRAEVLAWLKERQQKKQPMRVNGVGEVLGK
jgi:predicted DNA-binding transcriptional regulator AlpA